MCCDLLRFVVLSFWFVLCVLFGCDLFWCVCGVVFGLFVLVRLVCCAVVFVVVFVVYHVFVFSVFVSLCFGVDLMLMLLISFFRFVLWSCL